MDRILYPRTGYGVGKVELEFQFQCNGASNPVASTIVGVSNGAGGNSNAPPVIATITLAATGKYLVTLSSRETFQKVVFLTADLDDSANDGAYATVANVANEASSTGITFNIYTRAGATTTATNYTARIVRVKAVFNNSKASM